MGFAPANDPQVAVALIVENGGWGATVAAPIARKVFDYWLSPNREQAPEYVPEFYEEEPSEEVSPDVEVPAEPLRNPEDKLHDEATPDILGLVPTLQDVSGGQG
jgi:penicillin-binding protein 2